MVSVTARIELEGNFFRHDPGKTLYANIGDMLDGLADEMQTAARGEIEAHRGEMPYWTGWTTEHTVGYRRGRKPWVLWAAVAAGPNVLGLSKADSIRTRAAAAGIEQRFHPFRAVKGAVYRARSIISANLAKNLE